MDRQTLRGLSFALTMVIACLGINAAIAEDGHDHVHTRKGFDYSMWEAIPIQEGGLEKSLYTFAKETVRELTGQTDFEGRPPMENLFSMALEPERWFNEPILKLHQPDLKKLFGLEGHKSRISPMQLETRRAEWEPMAKDEKNPARAKEISTELNHLFHEKIDLMAKPMQELNIVPVVNFRGEKDTWKTVEDLQTRTKTKNPQEEKLIASWNAMKQAFLADNAAQFNASSAEAVQALKSLGVPTFKPEWKVKLDRWDSKVALFRIAGWVYLLSALLFLASYLAGKKWFTISAGATLGLGVLLHIAALVIRGVLAGRTPVANLFESAVFIIGAMTLLSCIISFYYRAKVVGLGGATLGAFFMGIANTIPLQYGRKIMPLVDALQSYWLRIHVTSMLTSYAFFSLSFFVAVAYLVRRFVLARRGTTDLAAEPSLAYLDGLNFRIITIGFPILTGGVILGAVWASEAWGRPWAFDPKETAAAITWMIYALYLHARLFLGWRGPRGVWISILGAGAVLFTYLGVSFFLPGLHSYVSEGMSFGEFLKKLIPGI